MRCPSCQANDVSESFFYCARQPVNENVLFDSYEAAVNSPAGSIDMRFCSKCGIVFNASFSLKEVDYGEAYQYCAPPTPTFDKFVDDLVDLLIQRYGISDSSVVEFGCGQGEFLTKLCARGGNQGWGFDTAYAGEEFEQNQNIQFARRFYDSTIDFCDAGLVCARQVLEHIQAPGDLLVDLSHAAGSKGKVYIEVPNLDWILKETVIWDFYFEHCSYFSGRSLTSICNRFGIEHENVEELFSGQYIGFFGKKSQEYLHEEESPSIDISYLRDAIERFEVRADKKRSVIATKCEEFSAAGSWCIWGGAAKGVTFCNLFADSISGDFSVIDINPIRQNKYVPVAGFPINAPESLIQNKPHTIVVMNSNYVDEIKATADAMGLSCDILACDNLA